MFSRLLTTLLAAVVFTSLAGAQVNAWPMPAAPSPAQTGPHSVASPPVTITFNARPPVPFAQPAFFAAPYLYSNYAQPIVQLPQPQVVLVPTPLPAEPSPETRPEPLLIEWEGDRYIRFGGSGSYTSAGADYVEAITRHAVAARNGSMKLRLLPPALLVYSDGHTEELTEYTIFGSVIYAPANYWRAGQWTKQIHISSLDLPATMEANQRRGTKFMLPSAPNVVITRP